RRHKSLVQIAFVLRNTPVKSVPITGTALRPIELDKGSAKYELMLVMDESDPTLKGEFEYNTDLFETITIQRIATSFHTLLQSIVAYPGSRLSALSVLTKPEQKQDR